MHENIRREVKPQSFIPSRKLSLPLHAAMGDRNIRRQEPIDHAAWLWHPEVAADEPSFLRFKCSFESEGAPLRIHLTADQHYILFVDGQRIARGPNRSDVAHWVYGSYVIDLTPGTHVLEASVWWLGDHAPMCMMTHRGGFALFAEGTYEAALSTGQGPWQVTRFQGWTMRPSTFECYHAIGDSLHIDAATWHASENEWSEPKVIRPPVEENDTGVDLVGGWKCFPSRLPALMDYHISGGSIRAILTNPQPGQLVAEADLLHPDLPQWNALLARGEALEIPANQHIAVLWDFENYYCGFHQIQLSGGQGSRLECHWAESLFLPDGEHKGHRGEIVGKQYIGFGDGYTCDGEARNWIPYWVCSGRYLLIEIKTSEEPLKIEELCINEMRYPLEMEARIDTGHVPLQEIIPLCLRALQSCSHDHYVDCPYYEQMMYVGDTRLELLATSVLTRDQRLQQRSITLFDYSRRAFGFVAERYTAREDQLSTTFAAIWVLCVRDFALWRDDPDWVRERMSGVRANLDCFLPYRNKRGLLKNLPGWSFIDWVEEWKEGYAPGHWTGCCAPSNLFYLLSLQAAAELETMLGSAHRAAYYKELAEETSSAIEATFWNEEQGLYADDAEGNYFSQHSQCLAIISGMISKKKQPKLLDRMLKTKDLAQASIYFQHYLFEAFYRCRNGDALLEHYEPWFELKNRGLYTTVESFEPTRSDCHAWGSHALYHMVASLAGIRPASASFKKIHIEPLSVELPCLRMQIPHPSGMIELDLKRHHGAWYGIVVLPKGCSGRFVDGAFKLDCRAGETRIPQR